tara:strand:- start:1912 stop:2313 length:402 start_codon:yes stop_codon:yes gene_type:complete
VITLGKASGELKLNGSAQSNGTTVVLVVVVEDVEDVEVVVVVEAITSKHPSILQSGVIVVVVVVVGVAVVLVVVVVLVLEVLVVVVVGLGQGIIAHVVISHTVGSLHNETQPAVRRITLLAISSVLTSGHPDA